MGDKTSRITYRVETLQNENEELLQHRLDVGVAAGEHLRFIERWTNNRMLLIWEAPAKSGDRAPLTAPAAVNDIPRDTSVPGV